MAIGQDSGSTQRFILGLRRKALKASLTLVVSLAFLQSCILNFIIKHSQN